MKTFSKSGPARAGLAIGAALLIGGALGARALRTELPAGLVPLPTGKAITPEGEQTPVGSFPCNLAATPDGRYVVVTDSGYREHLSVIRAADGQVVSQLPFNSPRAGRGSAKTALYYGLACASAPGGGATLYVSRGPEAKVTVYSLDADGKLSEPVRELGANSKALGFVAGLALNGDGSRLYAVDNETTAASQHRGIVSILESASGKVLGTVQTPGFPLAVAALTHGAGTDRKLYVSSERDGVVSVIDVSNPAAPKLVRDIPTGDHPTTLLFDREQKRLFVTNAGSDTVSVIDTTADRVTDTLLVRPQEARGLPGATPTGMALSRDESRLFVTMGDLNAVAVVKLPTGNVEGYAPAGWYPSAVLLAPNGHELIVANAKGTHARNPNKSPGGPEGKWGQYIQDLIEGTVARMPVPSPAHLKELTKVVIRNNRLAKETLLEAASLPHTGIEHVIYILKENRTYDQVLGDLPAGNGDPSMVLFGKDVTPNLHALASRFVLLDNFYCAAEVSADGWNWSTSGMANEYAERNVPFGYSGRGRTYDFEGKNNGEAVDLMGLPDVARSPGGYIWDRVAEKGLSYRNYGFFVNVDLSDQGVPLEGKGSSAANQATKKVLTDHTANDYRQFDMAYADSTAWIQYDAPAPSQKKTYGKYGARCRFEAWKREFDQYVKDGNLPRFTMLRVPRDHTSGTTAGLQTPRAMVADNDYAVGQIVEAVSNSPFWKSTAIFVLEDDAQGGHDHVDAHRSTAYVISPYIRRGYVDHRFYNTDSALHTMEVLLGLKPMCQYDATAPVIDAFDSRPVNAEPYHAILPDRSIIAEFNRKTAYRAATSAKLDFNGEDRVPDALLNDIIWHSVKGAHVPEPKPRHAAQETHEAEDRD